MNLHKILFVGMLALAMSAAAMTDDEVLRYIRSQSANGKSERQIGKELLSKGVGPEQVKRIRAKYQADGPANGVSGGPTAPSSVRNEDKSVRSEMPSSGNPGRENAEIVETAVEVYGHDLFNSRNLTFEPNQNLATPKNYRLGPGDQVVIDVWGDAEEHLREVISPEGSIMVSLLGPVYLNGKTIDEANAYVKNLFARKYAGVSDAQTDINVTLGEVRSIQVDIMGEVSTPGTFRMSPFSTVFHALYNAGGINNIGSMRNISVLRNGKRVANVDIYDYLFNGRQTGNIRLQEGDVIIVPPYEQIVNIAGNVKRPMYYEIKPGETVASLLDYAGGMAGDAYSGMVRLSRQNGAENELYNIDKGDFASYQLKDGDVVTVGTVLDRFTNRVEIKGAVTRPGLYALGEGTATLGSLIRKADGLTDDAYRGRALVYRQGEDMTMEVIPVNLGSIMTGAEADLPLHKNDIIEIASVQEIDEKGDFSITGMVTSPGSYSYVENTTVEDLILRAGGLREGASTARVDISRRIVDPASVADTRQIAEIFTVNISGGLGMGGNEGSGFVLKPYDRVTVRKAPGYSVQKEVTVEGEILFPGPYTLQVRNERLSDVVKRAGGVAEGAYLKGAYLKRRLSADEIETREKVLRIAMQNQQGSDSISEVKIDVADVYNVGIDLVAALDNPGSSQDLVLQDGDRLYIPEYQNTVKISGDVMYPNSVVFEPGKKVSYYINQAGGYGTQAKKGKCFIVYMNGQVAKVGRRTVVNPGSHIIVPSKEKGNGVGWEKVLAIASGFGSLTTMAATVASLLR